VIEEARRFIERRTALRPRLGVVLAGVLGAFADELSESGWMANFMSARIAGMLL